MARSPKEEEAWRVLVDLYLSYVADTLPSGGNDPARLGAEIIIEAPRQAKTVNALLEVFGYGPGNQAINHERRNLLYTRLRPRWLKLVQRWALNDEITVDELGDWLLTLDDVEGRSWGITRGEQARALLDDPTLLPFLLEDLPAMMPDYLRRTLPEKVPFHDAVFSGYGHGPDNTEAITTRLWHLLNLLARRSATGNIMRLGERALKWRWLQLFVSWWKYEEANREEDPYEGSNPAFLYLDDDPHQTRLFEEHQRALVERTFDFEWPIIFYESDLEALDDRRHGEWKGYRTRMFARIQDPPEEGEEDYPEEETRDYSDDSDETLENVARRLEREGLGSWSSGPFPSPGDWLSQEEGSIDYGTGQETRLDAFVQREGQERRMRRGGNGVDLSDIEVCFLDCAINDKFFW